MRNKLIELFKVKSIVTIALTVVFCILSIRGTVNTQDFLTVFTVVISFYFGTKHEQLNNNK